MSLKYPFNLKSFQSMMNPTKSKSNSVERTNKLSCLSKQSIYDEIEQKDMSIKESARKLRHIKDNSIKEFVYTNGKIPEQWKNKLDYQDEVIKVLINDDNFLTYLGKGGGGPLSSRSENKSLNYTSTNIFTNFEQIKQNSDLPMLTLDGINNSNRGVRLFSTKSFRRTLGKQRFLHGQKHNVPNEKEIINILDDLKAAYPIKEKLEELYPEKFVFQNHKNKRKMNINITDSNLNFNNLMKSCKVEDEKMKDIENNNLPSSTNQKDFNKTQTFFENNHLKRRNAFRQNIFNNLVPRSFKGKNFLNCENNKNNPTQSKPVSAIIRKNTKNKNSKEIEKENDKQIFLNSDSHIFNKKIKISNPLVKKYLESINYFGPYYSFCPLCRNRNMEFYNNLEPKSCGHLIQFIKKSRGKSAIYNKGKKFFGSLGQNNGLVNEKNKKNKLVDKNSSIKKDIKDITTDSKNLNNATNGNSNYIDDCENNNEINNISCKRRSSDVSAGCDKIKNL